MQFRVSGQYLYFTLIATQSGTAVTGASGQISGTRFVDGVSGARALSGNVVEDAGGMYHANLYDWDTSGSYIGYLFSCSGCIPVSFQVETDLTSSGRLYLASGQSVSVLSGQLSGQPVAGLSGQIYTASGMWHASGETVVVPPATLSGVVANSGLFVNATVNLTSGQVYLASGTQVLVYSGQLSGQPVAGLSGQVYTASGVWPASGATVVVSIGSISGVHTASGDFATVPASSLSGVTANSGLFVTVPPATLSGVVANSGLFVNASVSLTSGQVWIASGTQVLVYSGQLSGQPVAGLSGQVYTASGVWPASGANVVVPPATLSGVVANSGLFVSVPTASISGVNPASGAFTVASVTSGTQVLVYSGQLSGQPVAGLSGQIYTASGIWHASGETVVVPTASLSGVVANSGLFVTVPTATISGTWPASGATVVVPPSTISGVNTASGMWPASGAFVVSSPASGTTYLASGQAVALLSGQSVLVYSGQLSGQPVAGLSGLIYTASGMWTASGETVVVPPATLSGVVANSGLFVTVPVSTISGVNAASGIWPASGAFTVTSIASGAVYLASGTQVLVYSGQLSGQPVAGLSGLIYTASGMWTASGETVVVPPGTLSGITANSGLFVTVPPSTISGTWPASGATVVVPPSTISGVNTASGMWPASGAFTVTSIASGQVFLASGTQVLVYSGQLSGQPIAGLSGQVYTASGIWPASGANAVVPPATLSGVTTNSGLFVTVPVSTISGVNAASGIWPASGAFTVTSIASGTVYLASGSQVLVYSGQLSGQPVAGLSGQIYTASGIWPASGAFTNATATLVSGQVFLASGSQVLVYSGQLSGQPVAGLSGFVYPASGIWPASGAFAVTTVQSGQVFLASGQAVALLSGQSVLVYSGQLSGQPIAGLSGFIYTASGIWPASGAQVATSISLASGQVWIASGTLVLVYSGQLSGQPVAGLSGQIYTASGMWHASGETVVVLPSTISGVSTASGIWPASGAFTVTSIQSGQVYLASGQAVALLSGQSVLVYSGQLSGQPVAGLSGQIYTASGVWPASGANVLAAATVSSGTLYLASGSIFITTFASGVVGGGSGNLPSSWGGSGAVTVGQNLDKSGYNLTSGGSFIASGSNVVVPPSTISGVSTASGMWPASGAFTVTTVQSGQVYLASGQAVALLSGQSVLVYSGQLSGQPIAGLSGQVYTASGVWPASGANVIATATVSSGTLYLASGSIFITTFASGVVGGGSGNLPSSWGASGAVTVGQNLVSGTFVTVPISSISGVNTASGIWPASGAFTVTSVQSGQVYLASGTQVLVYSGQLSGQPIAGLSGQIYTASGIWPASGANVIATATVASGQVYLASGQAVALLSGQSVLVYSGQLSGQPIAGLSGFVYTASGVWPASGANVVATATVASGQVWLASGQAVSLNSGQSVLVYSGQLSGQPIAGLSGFIYPASGVSTVTSIASGTVYLASGTQVLVYSGQLSGQPIAGLSGQIYTASGVWPASGANVVATATVASGTVFLASGQAVALLSGQSVLVYSGQLSGQPVAGLSGFIYPASGVFTVTSIASGTVYLASGSQVLVASGQLSGQPIAGLSGFVYPASGVFTTTALQSGQVYLASGTQVLVYSGQLSGQPVTATANSGLFVTVPVNTISGVNAVTTIASGTTYLASGQAVALLSGQSVLVYSGQLSGQPVAGLSGFIFPASGINTVGTATVASGTLYLASGSIFNFTFASGVIGGGSGNLPSAWGGSGAVTVGQNLDKSGYSVSFNFDKSGYTDIPLSGQTYIASGAFVNASVTVNSGVFAVVPPSTLSGVNVVVGQNLDKSGYSLAPAGTDTVAIENGINMRQAIAIIGASAAGKLSGAGTSEVLLEAMGNPGTNRIDAAVDQSGNRVTVLLNPPP